METRPSASLLTGRTLFRTGLALVILSVAFLLRYSIEQGWFGPLARVGLAASAGAVMIGIGLSVGQSRRLYANLLQGGGAAILYLTAFAAHRQYGLIDTTEALIQLAAVSVVAIGLAVHSRSELLATIGLIGAGSAPLLLGGRLEIPGGDAPYMAIVAAAAAVLLFKMRWVRSYAAAAATISVALFIDVSATLDNASIRLATPAPTATDVVLAIGLAWIVLVVVPLIAAYLPRLGESASIALPGVTTSFGSALAYLALRVGFSESLTQLEWAAVAVAGAALHVAAGLGLHKRDLTTVAQIQIVPVVILSIAAIATALSGTWILVGLAAVSAGAALGGRRSGVPSLTDVGHAGMALTFIATSITTGVVDIASRTIGDIVPGGIVLGIVAITGLLLHLDGSETKDVVAVYHLSAYIGTLGWMLIEFSRLGESGLAIVTAGWALLGLSAIAAGKLRSSRVALGIGFTTLGLALAKLFLVDLAEAPPVTRIALFAGIGVALLLIGYWLGDGPSMTESNLESEPTESAAQGPYTTESI